MMSEVMERRFSRLVKEYEPPHQPEKTQEESDMLPAWPLMFS